MEKGDWADEKDFLPPPSVSNVGRAGGDDFRRRRMVRHRLVAAFVLLVIGGWNFASFRAETESTKGGFDPDTRGKLTVKEAEELFLTIPSESKAIKTSYDYSTIPHLAGSDQDLITAKSFLELLQEELGISTSSASDSVVYDAGSPESQAATLGITKRDEPSAWIDKYYPVMNTPLDRALEILDDEDKPVWKADVEESEEEGDPAGKYAHTVGAWHGLSKGGDVKGKLVYVNYGRKEDFDALSHVDLSGTIALIRYGGVFRGLKVKAAQEAGCVGAIVYSDPRDDGLVTEAQGYLPYPAGPARNPNAVQRGSVQFISLYPGDPSTPGVPAYPNATRIEATNIPTIPSIPISWNNAKRLLEEFGETSLEEAFKLDGKKSQGSVRLLNQVDDKIIPIWNVYGVIPGHIKDEVVVLGNHRDAWVTGAVDPTSGTASTVEIVRGLGELYRKGWKPLRTILIASWDAEEYGLVGSTEFGEDFPEFLKKHVVAYLNIDGSAGGGSAHFAGSPSLAHLARSVAHTIAHPSDPNRNLWSARDDRGPFTGNRSSLAVETEAGLGIDHLQKAKLRAAMDADEYSTGVSPLGSGSDFTVFLQRLGVASLDGGFGGSSSDAVYHYHSVYDSHQWELRYGDPGFHRHVSWAKYVGIVTLKLADSIVLPFNTTQYSKELDSYLAKVEDLAKKNQLHSELQLHHLRKAISRVQKSSLHLDRTKFKAEKAFRKALEKVGKRHDRRHGHSKLRNLIPAWVQSYFPSNSSITVSTEQSPQTVTPTKHCIHHHESTPWTDLATASDDNDVDVLSHPSRGGLELRIAARLVQRVNSRLRGFERGFISKEGIQDREWYKHLGVAPGKWLGYGATTFPALSEAIDEKDIRRANYEVERLVVLLERLAIFLRV